jgi:hypothetical protein
VYDIRFRVLFNDALSDLQAYSVAYRIIMHCKDSEIKRLWPNLCYYPEICLKELRK